MLSYNQWHILRDSLHLYRASLATTGQDLSSLAVLAEVIGSLKVPGSLELVACLLETLSKVVSNVSPDVADKRYIEQLLMSAIENVVENLAVSSSTTRIRCGRVSSTCSHQHR